MTRHDPHDVDLFSAALTHAYTAGNRRFRPRSWLARRVAMAMRDPACRFVLLTAAPGAGKSAFMAWLAERYPSWPRYFIRKDQSAPLDDPGAGSFLLKVGFQLAARFPELFSLETIRITVDQRLGSTDSAVAVEVGRLVASPFHQVVVDVTQQVRHSRDVAAVRIGEWVTSGRLLPASELQFHALLDPAVTLARTQPGKRIVILIDGLDEIRHRDERGQRVASDLSDQSRHGKTLLDWLAECPELPPNVRLVLTSRPDEPLLARFRSAQAPWLRELRIDAAEPDVRIEVANYALALAAEPSVAALLAADGVERTATFADDAAKKANGNIGYLDAVARAVDNAVTLNSADRLRRALALTALPDTLAELNAHFLHQVRDVVGDTVVEVFEPATAETHYMRAWPAVHRRILGVLTVARRPLDPDEVRTLGGIGVELGQVIDALEMLRQFLDRVDTGYQFYHTSLVQLLTDPATRENPEFADLYQDPAAWHGRIAALGATTIERLRRDTVWPSDVPPYLLRHLGDHLERSGADLDRLAQVARRPWLDAWRASDQLEWGILTDVDRVGRAAIELNRHSVTTRGETPGLRWEVTAALMRATLVSMSRGTPPALLEAMLGRAVWTVERALAEVRQAPRPLERVLGLVVVAARVAAPGAAELLDEAVAMLDLLDADGRDAVRKAECRAALAAGDSVRAMRAQLEVHDEDWRTQMLTAHAGELTAGLDEQTLVVGLKGLRTYSQSKVLVTWSLSAGHVLQAALIRRALAGADELLENDRAVTYLSIAASSATEYAYLVDRALDLAEEVSEWGMGDEYCRGILAALPPSITTAQLDRCWEVVDRIAHLGRSAGPVAAELVRYYPPADRHAARRSVLAILLQEGIFGQRSIDLFTRWVGDVDDEEVSALLQQFIEGERIMGNDLRHAPAVLALADRVSDDEFDARAKDALVALVGMDHGRKFHANAIAPLIPARRWARVLELFELLRTDDGLGLTMPGNVITAQGVSRKPMTRKDRHAALCEVLEAAVSVLPAELLTVAAQFATAVPDASTRCRTLAALLPRVEGALRDSIARDALVAGQAASFSDALFDLMSALPADLPLRIQRKAVHAAAKLWRGKRTTAVSSLAPKLGAEPLRELYRTAHMIDDRLDRVEFVAAAAPLATPAAATAWVEYLIRERSASLAASVAAQSRLEDLPRLLRLHDEISDAALGADYLAALAPQLEGGQLDDALQQLDRHAIALANSAQGQRSLGILARRCAELGHFRPALDVIGRWPLEWVRADALRAMSGQLAPEFAGAVERLARDLTEPGARAEALCALAAFAVNPDALRTELLETGVRPSICLTVLASGWPDKYDMRTLWQEVVDESTRTLNTDDLDAALTRSSPDVRRQAVDLIIDRTESGAPKLELRDIIDILPLLPRHATAEQMMRLARLARHVNDVHFWSRIAAPLLEYAQPKMRDALIAAARFQGTRGETGTDAITEVIAAQFAPEPLRRQVIDTTMTAIRQGQEWLLPYLLPLLLRQPVDDAYHHLSSLIAERSVHGRDTLLKAMTNLGPAIGYVGGPHGADAVLDATRQVCDWWP